MNRPSFDITQGSRWVYMPHAMTPKAYTSEARVAYRGGEHTHQKLGWPVLLGGVGCKNARDRVGGMACAQKEVVGVERAHPYMVGVERAHP